MNNNGFREYYRMRLRPEVRRYMNEVMNELVNRGFVGDYLFWVLEANERTHFLYELKHNPDYCNIPVKERADHILITAAIEFQVDKEYWWGYSRRWDYDRSLNRSKVLNKVFRCIKNSGIVEKYMSEIERYPLEENLKRLS